MTTATTTTTMTTLIVAVVGFFPLSPLLLLLLLLWTVPRTSHALSRTDPNSNNNRVAVVTGASRGIGRGIAIELGLDLQGSGWTVYCLGRSSRKSKRAIQGQRPVAPGLELTVESVAEEITATMPNGNSVGIPVPIDLADDRAIDNVMERVQNEQGRLDLLVCSAYTTPGQSQGLRGNFWDQDLEMWDAVNGLGLRQVYACCRAAAPLMIETAAKDERETSPPPLMCLVSSFGGKSYTFNVPYGVGKAGVDRMAVDMSYQLQKYGVATTALYPGLVRTEANIQMQVDGTWNEASGGLDLGQGESPCFSGRAVVALTKLDRTTMMERSGNVEVVAELAKEFDFEDVDGSRPSSIRSLRYLYPTLYFRLLKNNLENLCQPGYVKMYLMCCCHGPFSHWDLHPKWIQDYEDDNIIIQH